MYLRMNEINIILRKMWILKKWYGYSIQIRCPGPGPDAGPDSGLDANIYYMSQRLKSYRKSTMIICFPVNRSKLSGSLLKSGKIGWNKDLTESYVSCFSHQALKRASHNAQLGERI